MLNRRALVGCAYCGSIPSFHRSAGLRWHVPSPSAGPSRREGPCRSVVPVWLPAAWGRRPRPRLLAAWRVLSVRYRAHLPAPARPPYQCFDVPSPIGCPIGFSVRALPPLFVFPFGVCRRVCRHRGAVGGPYVLARPSPPSPVAVSACVALRRCRPRSPDRARPPFSCFRSVGFGGLERPSRIPIADRSKFDRRSKSQ